MVLSVLAGAKRFVDADWLRFDKALHALPGIERFPGADTVRNLFTRELIEFLEQRAMPYAVGEFFAQIHGWNRKRRFVVIRERIRESKEAVGRKLLDGPWDTVL